jgi:hypothetical protein
MRTKIATILIAFIAIYVVAYVSRAAIARSYPGVPAYYSFDGDIFTFDHTYSTGTIGPFTLNMNKEDLMRSIDRYNKSFIFTIAMNKSDEDKLYYKRNLKVSSDGRRVLLSSDHWKISFREHGSVTIYHVDFSQGRATRVRLVSTLGA